MCDFFQRVHKGSKNNPESLVGMYSIKEKAQYFFIVENTLYLKLR